MSLFKIASSKSISSQWSLSRKSAASVSFNDEDYPLRIIKQSTFEDPTRPPVKASLLQRISYYQHMVNSPSKSQFQGTKPYLLKNWMLLVLAGNISLGALGTYYIQVFLGVFAADQHLYLSKMVPVAYGINILYFFSAIADLSRLTDISIAFLDSFIMGVYKRAPWNRCADINATVLPQEFNNKTIEYECVELNALRYIVSLNKTDYEGLLFSGYSCYKFNYLENCVQIPQILFMESRRLLMVDSKLTLAAYFVVLWTGCVLASKQIYHSHIWKILIFADMLIVGIYSVVAVHVIFFPDHTPRIFLPESYLTETNSSLHLPVWELIELMSSCFVFSPPMIHFLSARCKKVKPATESFAMTISTVLHLIFYIAVNIMVYSRAMNYMGGMDIESLCLSTYSYMNVFYWLVYFSTFPTGNIFSLVFLLVNFVMEFSSMVITFNCFIEIYASEYTWSRRWFVITLVLICSSIYYACIEHACPHLVTKLFKDYKLRIRASLFIILWIRTLFGYGIGPVDFWILALNSFRERYVIQFFLRACILTLDVLFMHFFYPLRRLLDDITFYFGVAPSTMRYFSIIMSIVVEMILLIVIYSFDGYTTVMIYFAKPLNFLVIYVTLITFVVLPMLAGIAFVVLKYIFIEQKDWTLIFIPVDDWGPAQFLQRQLRKEFDSTTFTPCHAPRVLSRHLLKNTRPDTYKLNIVYQFVELWRRRTSTKSTDS